MEFKIKVEIKKKPEKYLYQEVSQPPSLVPILPLGFNIYLYSYK